MKKHIREYCVIQRQKFIKIKSKKKYKIYVKESPFGGEQEHVKSLSKSAFQTQNE